MVALDTGSQSVVSRTETSALLGKVLEMPFWSPVPIEAAMVGGGWGTGICTLSNTLGDSHAS